MNVLVVLQCGGYIVTTYSFPAPDDLLPAALMEIGAYMVESVRENFETGGRPFRWLPDSPATVKRKHFSAPNIDTGKLMRSIGASVRGDTVIVDTETEYAGYAEAVRPYMLFQRADLSAIEAIIAGYIK